MANLTVHFKCHKLYIHLNVGVKVRLATSFCRQKEILVVNPVIYCAQFCI